MENEKLQYQVDTQGKEIAVLKSDIKNMSNTLTQLLIDVKVMNENIKNVASKQDNTSKEIQELKMEVKSIKEEPAKDYKTIKTGIITTVITSVVGFIMYQLGLRK